MTDAILIVFGTYLEYPEWDNCEARCDILIATTDYKLALEVCNEYRDMPDKGGYQNIYMETH